MKLKEVAIAAALCGMAAGSFASSPSVTMGSDGTLGIGMGGLSGSFTDTWTIALGTFTLAPKYNLASSFTSLDSVKFTSITLMDSDGGSFAYAIDNTGLGGKLSIGALTASAGSFAWTVEVKGDVTGSFKPGSYGGQFTVTPVPEPETYALMLAGLGAIGYLARRRKV